jgi:uncharacterized protein YbaA (DUF1428 family)
MTRYVDSFVAPVPKKNIEAYRTMAETMSKVWKEYGALECIECLADDVKPGELTSFPQSVKLKDDETVVCSYIIYESKQDRDRINEKAMADPRIKNTMGDPQKLPFDGKRMFFGGFDVFAKL